MYVASLSGNKEACVAGTEWASRRVVGDAAARQWGPSTQGLICCRGGSGFAIDNAKVNQT